MVDSLQELSRKGHLSERIDGMDRVGVQIDHSPFSCYGKVRTVFES